MKRKLVDLEQYRYQGVSVCPNVTRSNSVEPFDHDYYDRWLRILQNPEAIRLRDIEFCQETVFGFSAASRQGPGKLGGRKVCHWLLKEKTKFPRCLLAVQVGGAFEFRGIDALLCLEYGGSGVRLLSRHRVRFSMDHLQVVLDTLVEQDLMIRVYETTRAKGLPQMFQMVCKSNPVYFRSVQSVCEDATHSHAYGPVVYVFQNEVMVVHIKKRQYIRYADLSHKVVVSLVSSLRPVRIFTSVSIRGLGTSQRLLAGIDFDRVLSDLLDQYAGPLFTECLPISGRIPLMRPTCDQLGIASSLPDIPDLLVSMLGTCSLVEKQFFTSWVSVKPSRNGRQAMQRICKQISTGQMVVQNIRPLEPDRIYGLLLSGGCCQDRSLLQTVYDRVQMSVPNRDIHCVSTEFLGYSQTFDVYESDLVGILRLLGENLCFYPTSSDQSLLPSEFVYRNERHIVAVPSAIEMVNTRNRLNSLIQEMRDTSLVTFSVIYYAAENEICFKLLDHEGRLDSRLIHVNGRRGSRQHTWTTDRVNTCMLEYVRRCEVCFRDQVRLIGSLCRSLTGKYGSSMRVFLQNEVVGKSVHTHLTTVISKGWCSAVVCTNEGSSDGKISIDGLFPHWLSQMSAVTNQMKMDRGEIILLTAPNASGKTTLIRSFMTVAILAHAGCYVPARTACFPELDYFRIRLPTGDRPLGESSSFESEVYDLSQILDGVMAHRTLICLDEVARSTCPKEGFSIAQSIVEHLIDSGVYCIFSSHFLGLLKKDLAVTHGTMTPTFKYAPGCTDSSGALAICSRYELPSSIVTRARYLLGMLPCTKPSVRNSVQERLESIATETTGVCGVHVPQGQLIPPSLTASPCVYLIEEQTDRWYCGESKHMINRFAQHARQDRCGHLILFVVANKSLSLQFETLIQRRCLQEGIALTSFKDSYHQV